MATSGTPLYRSEYEPRAFSTTLSSPDRFWAGFATGALIGTAGAVAAYMITGAFRGGRDPRIVRFETSIQIGRKPPEVFRAWSEFDRLPELLDVVKQVHSYGKRSHWVVNVDGKDFEWEAETIQFIPNEAIGWKSVSGPKHTGRITFASIGDDTLMHVSINYAPPLGRLGALLSPMTEHIEGWIEEALRDFKAALESHSYTSSSGPERAEWRQTGTEGSRKLANPVDYTRPPDARYPISNEKISGDR